MGGAASVWLGRERKDMDAVINIDAPFFSDLVYKKETDDFVARDVKKVPDPRCFKATKDAAITGISIFLDVE